MFSRHGGQLAADCLLGRSAVEKRFFDVLLRWSRVGCTTVGSRSGLRRNTTEASPSVSHPPSITAETLSHKTRRIMRLVPQPVVVLTTTASSTPGIIDWSRPGLDEAPDPSLYRGMTLSSFTSLSLSPEPLITFNIGFPSRTVSALTQNQHFLIHILKATHKGSAIADAFTKGNIIRGTSAENATENESAEADNGGNIQKPITAFDLATQTVEMLSIETHTIQRPVKRDVHLPLLKSNAVEAVLECKVLPQGERAGGGLLRIGDHVLVIAKVTAVLEPLIFHPLPLGQAPDLPLIKAALGYVNGQFMGSTSLGDTEG